MSKFKKVIKYIGIVTVLLILCRGLLYRTSVNYSKIKVRNNVELTDEKLMNEIDSRIKNKTLNIEEIIRLSNQITSEKLSFTFHKTTSNPNCTFELKKANCIGYSSLFNSIGNYIIEKQKMTNQYEFIHLVGKLDVLGFDVHHLFTNTFFKNHDFNEILNKQTGGKKFVDPSLRDYFRIEYVTSKLKTTAKSE